VQHAANERLPVARANAWLLIANGRYWRTVAPVARAELRRWEQQARSIDDPITRQVALEKLRREGFNAEVAATLAVFAPRHRRIEVAKAIVALEVLYDYLDGLAALPRAQGSPEAATLFAPFVEAFGQPDARPCATSCAGDDGYAAELASTISGGLRLLPRASALMPTMRNAAQRTAEGQLRSHAVAREGRRQLEEWARSASIGSGLAWPEFAAGAAASVLAVHALIVAASDERTSALAAREIDGAYLMISAISTMLDSVNDYQRDLETGRPRAVDWYDRADPAEQITSLARRALARTASIPHGPRHAMVAAGVIAYYTSPPEARGERAQAVAKRVQRDLRAILWPTLAVMRTWRLAKRLRGRPHD
jgi:tetraprenyl-beta-curcumene synthase